LDEEIIDSIEGNLLPNETFLSSFEVNADGTLGVGTSGLYTNPDVLPIPASEIQAAAQPITIDSPITGLIVNEDFYDAYTFTGVANDLITVEMTATSGSLDTLLLLLDSAGNVVDFSDDIVAGEETNSRMQNV